MYKINDLIPDVRGKLRGRSDVNTRIVGWLKQSILDLTQSYPFEELSLPCPMTNFISSPLTSTYKIPYFTGQAITGRFTRILSWLIYYSVNPVIGVDTAFEMKGRALAVVRQQSTIKGIPVMYAQQGQNLIVGCAPNLNYATQMIVQKQHEFHPDMVDSEIFMPDDWREILVYAAAIRGCDELAMTEVGTTYYKRLHGDPKLQGDLGLLGARIDQQQRNMTNNERRLRLVVRRIGA